MNEEPRAHEPPPAGGVSDAELDGLFHDLRRHRTLALAVSGGGDSMALMLLVRRWCERVENPPAVSVLTVDHQLRKGSAEEARWVGEQARALGWSHHTLIWTAPPPESGIQAAARSARYDLMTAHALAHGITGIVTAHSSDDQAETLVMRLARGSGLDGLAGMAALTHWGGVEILRPLLSVSRSRLRETLRAARRSWLEDPSNEDTRFERVRVREALKGLADAGVTAEKLALSARRLDRARRALDQFTLDFLDRNLSLSNVGYGRLSLAALRAAPDEIALKALGRTIKAFGGRPRPPRLAKLEALFAELADRPAPQATLGGCLIAVDGDTMTFCRETGRMGEAVLELEPGGAALWDGRFVVRSPAGVPRLSVAPVRAANLQLLDDDVRQMHPRTALETAPGFYRQEALIAVPALGWVAAGAEGDVQGCRADFVNAALLLSPARWGQ